MRRLLLTGAALLAMAGAALAACPAITLDFPQDVPAGRFPQQYDLSEFEALAGCTLALAANPAMPALNARIRGNPDLPPLAERLPGEPLVVVPYDSIGRHGGTFRGLSVGPEAGTSDFLSLRHVGLVRFSDDLSTIVPNVARDWAWNDDRTELTFHLRKGHRWSDGAPFTAEDIVFWYHDLVLDQRITETPPPHALIGGRPMRVEAVDETTVRFILPEPAPGLLAHFATTFAQPFQPRHFLGRFHPGLNPDADRLAQGSGFPGGVALIRAYWPGSDWQDVPLPMRSVPDLAARLPKDAAPTLESHVRVAETENGRSLVANPYFFMVDTAGNQLPYIEAQEETFVADAGERLLMLVNGQVDYKSQSLALGDLPALLDGLATGDYAVQVRPGLAMPTVSFNVTARDPARRALFSDLRFRQAMSVAINRQAMNEAIHGGEGTPRQHTGFSPPPDWLDPALASHMTRHDPALARRLLDEAGMIDRDGDGARELPGGQRFVLNLRHAARGVDPAVVAMLAADWTAVGVRTTTIEITRDEYLAAQSANQLDVGLWDRGEAPGLASGAGGAFVPPFGPYEGHRLAMPWAAWLESGGAEGMAPPDWVVRLARDAAGFGEAAPGRPDWVARGTRMARAMAENLLFIGTVLPGDPVYHRRALRNFPDFRTASQDFFRAYPYRPQQWYLQDEGKDVAE
jgi:peptide/nickel transport system substrate-binding protein